MIFTKSQYKQPLTKTIQSTALSFLMTLLLVCYSMNTTTYPAIALRLWKELWHYLSYLRKSITFIHTHKLRSLASTFKRRKSTDSPKSSLMSSTAQSSHKRLLDSKVKRPENFFLSDDVDMEDVPLSKKSKTVGSIASHGISMAEAGHQPRQESWAF